MEPKEIVRTGYDRVSFAYRGDSSDSSFEEYKRWIDELKSHLPKQAHVLDLGCGCGLPATKLLAEDFAVTGVDISEVQIQRATALVPEATFLCRDMCDLHFHQESFEAIVCLYAIIHVPLGEQPGLLANLFAWLRPGGYLLATVGSSQWTGTERNWLGVEGGTMYWSHTDTETYCKWLAQTGFHLCWDRFIPEGDGGHTLLLAQKPET